MKCGSEYQNWNCQLMLILASSSSFIHSYYIFGSIQNVIWTRFMSVAEPETGNWFEMQQTKWKSVFTKLSYKVEQVEVHVANVMLQQYFISNYKIWLSSTNDKNEGKKKCRKMQTKWIEPTKDEANDKIGDQSTLLSINKLSNLHSQTTNYFVKTFYSFIHSLNMSKRNHHTNSNDGNRLTDFNHLQWYFIWCYIN